MHTQQKKREEGKALTTSRENDKKTGQNNATASTKTPNKSQTQNFARNNYDARKPHMSTPQSTN
jgi:hypothetical protein